ncbi:hypothetical protein AB0368_28860 [Actinoplanes sp. NPDC051475]|uniref:hypothetical protein n=1 Tax=Actinoplanes sp. NPDC051475 TaxID=3157225 RepID=UPI00344D6E5E
MGSTTSVLDSFARWEIGARVALADRGVAYETANPFIADAELRHAGTGLTPREALGAPVAFAGAVAGQLPAEARKPGRHQLVEILTDPAVVRIGWLAVGISTFFLAVTAYL